MCYQNQIVVVTAVLLFLCGAEPSSGAIRALTKTETFDIDPGWDGHNNRAMDPPPRQITQDFGYSSSTSNAGGPAGEIGGFITPAAEPAYYAKVIPVQTFNDTLSASGVLNVPQGEGLTLLGFFNSDSINEWRTPNTVSLRIYGRGSFFYAYADYGTDLWRAGGNAFAQSGSEIQFASGATDYNFSLTYDPNGNNGGGTVTGMIGGQAVITNLDPGHKADGATFNRFGLLDRMTSADGPGYVWLDNVTVNGVTDEFTTNPGWDSLNNQSTYITTNIRPRFDFGYSATNNAGGAASGEMGGLVFRGDSRVEFQGTRMAFYGDPLEQTLTLDQPLHAEGKVGFHRGVSDSTTLIGFFHSTDSIRNSNSQISGGPENSVVAVIEGPSAEGFYFYPSYGVDQEGVRPSGGRGTPTPPYIYPNGESHDWTLDYDPAANNGLGRVTVALDGQQVYLNLDPGHRQIGAQFDRFGIITTHIDGNGQHVYFDDLTYSIIKPPGDMDCDGDVDFDDIDDFVLGLNDPAAYESQFGVPPSSKGDTDGDGDQDFDDIDGFVTILSGQLHSSAEAVPEPTTWGLLLAGLGLLGSVRHRSLFLARRPSQAPAWYRRPRRSLRSLS